MAFGIDLSEPYRSRGWKAKILDDERNEEPHVTILWKYKKWRVSLRSWDFLDIEPPPREVPGDVLQEIRDHEREFIEAWDRRYPENVVWSPNLVQD